jgi:hypothetical protein
MPFTTQEILDSGKTSLDYYLKNPVEDQINIEHIWRMELEKNQKPFPGAKQNVTIQLRYRNQSNFQWFNGRKVVSYNIRHTIEQASFPWRGAHDGVSLDEDRLLQNGITVTDDKVARHDESEEIMLTDLLEEQTSVLPMGFNEKFDLALLRDGTAGTDDIAGLDHIVAIDPTTGTVGGIDRSVAANSWWRNGVQLGVTTTTSTGNILTNQRTIYRNITRNGGKPNLYMAGEDYIDGYVNFMLNTFGQINHKGGGMIKIEGGEDVPTYKGVSIKWVPSFADVDDLDSPAELWVERLYMLQMKYIQLKPIRGQDRIARKPPRPYDRYEYYWGLTWRGALCMSKAVSQAVMSVA